MKKVFTKTKKEKFARGRIVDPRGLFLEPIQVIAPLLAPIGFGVKVMKVIEESRKKLDFAAVAICTIPTTTL